MIVSFETAVQKLKNGEVCIKYWDSNYNTKQKDLELLRKLLKNAFPTDIRVSNGTAFNYGRDYKNHNRWSTVAISPTVRDLKYISIKDIADPVELKIKGYKSPFTIYDGRIPAGTLFILNSSNPLYYISNNTTPSMALVKEIVETWEPVYEEASTFIYLGEPTQLIEIGKDYIKSDGKLFTISSMEYLYKLMHNNNGHLLAGFTVEFPKVKIGCSSFNVIEIKQIIETFKQLNK